MTKRSIFTFIDRATNVALVPAILSLSRSKAEQSQGKFDFEELKMTNTLFVISIILSLYVVL